MSVGTASVTARMRHALPRLTVALSFALAGCSDAPTAAPALDAPAALRQDIVEAAVPAQGLQRLNSLAHDITVTARIDRRGGSFSIPEAGLRVVVPSGALTGTQVVNFTATALAGDVVAYDFGPHGLHFARPLKISQELRGTDWANARRDHLEAGYFASRSQLDVENNMVEINEFLPLDVDLSGSRMRFEVEHFSGYIITTGRNPNPKAQSEGQAQAVPNGMNP
jgi:hypothetical protein